MMQCASARLGNVLMNNEVSLEDTFVVGAVGLGTVAAVAAVVVPTALDYLDSVGIHLSMG